MTDFTAQIEGFVTKTKSRMNLTTGYIVADLARRIDERSPVGDPSLWKRPAPPEYRPGTFRGGWQLGIDSIPSGQTGRLDPGGVFTLAEIKKSIPEAAGGHKYFITNNVVYGPRLEDGWSTQAPPGGIVGLTALEFPQVVRAAAEGARK